MWYFTIVYIHIMQVRVTIVSFFKELHGDIFSRFANKDVGVQEIVSRRNDGLPRNASTRVRGPVTVIAILF